MNVAVSFGAAMLACGALAQAPSHTREVGVVRTRPPVAAPMRKDDPATYVFGSYHALLIGVARYEGHAPDLRTPHRDVRELAAVLERDYGFEPPQLLLDEQASRAGILAALDGLAQRLDERDNLLVFFAGHGTLRWAGSPRSQGFWIPYLPRGTEHRWWNWISADELNQATARIRAQHVLLVSDSCYSGALTRDTATVEAVTPSWIRQQHQQPSNQILTSGADEPVADDGRDGHSIFAFHLLDVLRHNGERFLPASTLGDHVVRAVMQDADFHVGRNSQQPVFARHPFDARNNGQFVFVRMQPVADGLRAVAVPGLPVGYRKPNFVEIEAIEAGRFRYWSSEGGERVEMVLVPGGVLQRGGETLRIEPFLVDRTEVDNRRFDRFIDATGARIGLRAQAPAARAPDVPATAMSLQEARAFAAWAGNKRLPTELEWQYAAAFSAKTGTLQRFPWGDAPLQPPLARQFVPQGHDPRDVSPFGVLGMGGSVREFCELVGVAIDANAPGAVCGGTQVVPRRGVVDAAIERSLRVEAQARHEGEVGFRCVKSLVPPYRRE